MSDYAELTKDDKEALRKFLKDIECLDPIYEYLKEPNFFEILKSERTEIRHSNMLAYLLDPSENHGFENKVLKRFIDYWADKNEEENSEPVNLGFYLKNYSDAVVYREHPVPIQDKKGNKYIDLIVVSDKDKLVLTIENKTDSGEHDNQLNNYCEYAEEKYGRNGYTTLYLYLSIDGTESTDPKTWLSISYKDVLEILQDAKSTISLSEKTELIVNDYIDCLRRNFMGNSELAEICDVIYREHKKALDILFEQKKKRDDDAISELNEKIKDQLRSDSIHLYVADDIKQENKRIRCRTDFMDNLFPDYCGEKPSHLWQLDRKTPTKAPYAYEIFVDSVSLKLTLLTANTSLDVKNKLIEIINNNACLLNNNLDETKIQEKNGWPTLKSFGGNKSENVATEEDIRELVEKWDSEVKEFEKEFKTAWDAVQ